MMCVSWLRCSDCASDPTFACESGTYFTPSSLRFGLLGLVRMVRARIDLQPLEHLGGQLVLGEHPADGFAEDAVGMARQAALGRFLPQAGVAREPGVFLLRPLLAGELDLLGVDRRPRSRRIGRAACRSGGACPSGSWRCRWPAGRRPCRWHRRPTTFRRFRPVWRRMSSFQPRALSPTLAANLQPGRAFGQNA